MVLCSIMEGRAQTVGPVARYPLLHQMDCETQSLYQSIKSGLVEVELPPPPWMRVFTDSDSDQIWNSRFNDELRDQLRSWQAKANVELSANSATANQPASTRQFEIQSSTRATTQSSAGSLPGAINFSPNRSSELEGELPKVLGVVLDDAGHVLLTEYIDKDAVQNRPILIINSDHCVATSHFVASDAQTGLTVVQMDKPSGTPLKLAGARPAEGALVMLLSSGGEGGQLTVWTGEAQDRGMVLGIDGTIHGFAKAGQFMSADTIRPLAEKLVRDHIIHRAFLGVSIERARTPDGRRALQIDEVIAHSAAAEAGLREGDFILSFAEIPVSDVPSFSAAIAETNGRVALRILRDEKAITISVEPRLR